MELRLMHQWGIVIFYRAAKNLGWILTDEPDKFEVIENFTKA